MPVFHAPSSPLLVAIPAFLAAAVVGYHMGRMVSRAQQKRQQPEDEGEGGTGSGSPGMQHNQALRHLIYKSTGRGFGVVKRVYVVPGGGPGSVNDAGYPPWTAQRVAAALQRYDLKYEETTAFLALGAGSMNVASPRAEDGHVVFESTRIAQELVKGGVPPGSVIADFVSWDTVGNAWFARLAVEALLDIAFRQGETPDELHAIRPQPLRPQLLEEVGDRPDIPGESKRPATPGTPDMPSTPPSGSPGLERPRGHEELVGPVQDLADLAKKAEEKDQGTGDSRASWGGWRRGISTSEEEKAPKPSAAELPAARAGEAYRGGEIRQWMFQYKAKRARARRGPLNVTVFVSDFHHQRMDAVFQWVFGLEPSLLNGQVTVTTVSLDTPVEMWARGAQERQARLAHERKATEQARLRSREIRTVEEFRAFMVLGGHAGYFNRTHGQYRVSPGAGWGGTS